MSAFDVSLVEHEQDVDKDQGIRHALSLDPMVRLCGHKGDMRLRPDGWGRVDCVVCMDLWYGMSLEAQNAIVSFWREKG